MTLAIICISAGLGLLAFWTWLLGIKGLASKPEIWPGYRDHELAFALPDIVLGIGFVASGIMSATGVKMA